jgi:hypothetical protein
MEGLGLSDRRQEHDPGRVAPVPPRSALPCDLRFLTIINPQAFRNRSAGVLQAPSCTLLDGAGEGPAARKEWVMDTHTIRRAQGMRASVIAVLLAVTIAAGVLAVQLASV